MSKRFFLNVKNLFLEKINQIMIFLYIVVQNNVLNSKTAKYDGVNY